MSFDWNSMVIWIRTFIAEQIGAFIGAALGAVALWAIYRWIETEWPSSYTRPETSAESSYKQNPVRAFLFFRGGPVALVSLFLAVILERHGASPWLGVGVLCLLHIWTTNFKALVDLLRPPKPSTWVVWTFYHLFTIATVVGTAALVTFFRDNLQWMIPGSDELLQAVWAGIFAAIAWSIARSILSAQKLEDEELVDSLIDDMGRKNWELIEQLAAENQTEEFLVKAIVLAEVEQRPRWFRRLERAVGFFRKRGTYGPAQVMAERPISDAESIELLFSNIEREGWAALDNGQGYVESGALEEAFLSHNQDSGHANRMIYLFRLLEKLESERGNR
ncbi:hypothetical protein [uncultured Corynebacterium sp.]|uniref:hypothetical protein n=1 Tax=uncultured Corynebacterium sp. TaxID=159447 RepID=UPI00288B69C0|nr:hypothetical protein [uncultured Corynebacterium sp.]